MSTEDFSQDGLRVGGWLPDAPTGGEPGTVYRGGSLAVSQMRVEPAADVPDEEPVRRGLRVVAGCALAISVVALSLATLILTDRPHAAREVGTMQYPEPLLPAPPELPPLAQAPSDPATPSGRPSSVAGGAAPVVSRPSPPASHGPDASPAPVAGTPDVSTPVSQAPAGPTPTPTPTPTAPEQGETVVPLVAGATVSLETMTRPGHLVRHDSARAVVGRVGLGSSPQERASAHFVIRTGLADPRCVSFESEDRPGRFLRHRDFAVYLHRRDRDSLFAKDATFCPVAGADGRHTSLRSRNYPDRYLTVRSSLLFLDRADAGAEARSFAVRPGA